MADRSKFEAMLELLVNEDKEGAEALFHEIVVEKSRDIYESLLEDEEVDEASDEEVDEASDEEVDESDEDLDEADEEVEESDDDLEEGFDLDEFEVEADPMMGGDPADDMMGDMEPDMGGDDDMDGEGDVEDRVEDLEDALEDLKAEFEKMMAGDDEGDDEGDDDMDMDMDMDDEEPEEEAFTYESADEEVEEAADEEVEEAADEEVEEAADEEVEEDDKSAAEQMREYVEKVAPAKHGDNGVNTKSSVAGKNDMGGTTANILRADTEESGEAGAGTTIKGNPVQKQAPAAMNTKNINVPGGKAGKTSFKKKEPGHGAETKGKPETADKAAGSTLNKLSKRAK